MSKESERQRRALERFRIFTVREWSRTLDGTKVAAALAQNYAAYKARKQVERAALWRRT